jgi:hypothetical protein
MHRLEDNFKMGLKEIRLRDVDWVHLAQDGAVVVVGSCVLPNELSGSIKVENFLSS